MTINFVIGILGMAALLYVVLKGETTQHPNGVPGTAQLGSIVGALISFVLGFIALIQTGSIEATVLYVAGFAVATAFVYRDQEAKKKPPK